MDIIKESTNKNVKAILPLCNASIVTVLHPTLNNDTTAPVSVNKYNQAFAIEQYREDGNIMTYFVANSAGSKNDWIKTIENILQEKSIKKSSKNLKEVSIVPIDINTPMLSQSKSTSSTNPSLI